jgi:hypothetical protein
MTGESGMVLRDFEPAVQHGRRLRAHVDSFGCK